MDRIIPQMVRQAYIETGMRPVRGAFYSAWPTGYDGQDGPCGCGVGTLLMQNPRSRLALRSNEIGEERAARFLGLPIDYLRGFLCGFDGGASVTHSDHEAFWQGWRDGQDTWRACVDLRNGFLPMVVEGRP